MNTDKVKLAIAPIAWTNDDLPSLGAENTFEQCVSEMALAGFTGCEVGNKYPKDPVVLKKQLSMRGLQICNAWFSTFFADGKLDETIAGFMDHMNFLHTMGAKVIGCSEQSGSIQGTDRPIFDDKPTFNDEQWHLVAKGYNKLSEMAAEKGMSVCLHHHMGTAIQTPAEIDRFMAEVEPSVGLLLDTGHIYYSEGNQTVIMDILNRYMNRIPHVHLKDIREEKRQQVINEHRCFLDGVRLGAFTVPGDGVIDFKPIFDALDKAGYEGWMVVEAEQDPSVANPLEYAFKARQYIREIAHI
ncbi:myo-inosose-2 dehydratase [Celerinatantimonas diazotrophica]|uniref:Inosose dehydratase n=1 Tax=Celerinatantimonas diazotrophica TaxID=412034 RepID=A0A4R1JLP8_9GAMM|nr:myo-inosose-2 dehydratase [Celerinatantimonas diazotrophica]TCK51984.1 2-keto-myo-inositol dehydratase [Celerinatantimonas diazotrophica]CAG9296315.1 Inosose dehydratase [Celerinatantimonas diazotrophica]